MKSSEIKPPVVPTILLRILCLKQLGFSVLGDFDEEFAERVLKTGRRKARIWYWTQFWRSLPKIVRDSFQWRASLFRNYLMIALRNIQRRKMLSIINIFGLSIALTFGVWIFLFVKDEVSYNKFHAYSKSIYSVINRDNYYNYDYRYIPNAVGPALKEFFPEVLESVRFVSRDVVIRVGRNMRRETCHFADKDFFRMFSFPLVQGDPDQVLTSQDAIVLTEESARKYFTDGAAVGQTLNLTFRQTTKDFIVSGIAKTIPSNSSLNFEFIVNSANLDVMDPNSLESWTWPRSHTFIRLKTGVDPGAIEKRVPSFVHRYMGKVIEERKARGTWLDRSETITFWLQNLEDIHFHSQAIAGERNSSAGKSAILAVIAFIVLLIACINFTNTSIGRAATRAGEIGVRKTLGAARRNLIGQFWSESIFTVLLSMICGLVLAAVLMPNFNSLAGKHFQAADLFQGTNILVFVPLTLIVGILAGFYPSMILSRIDPQSIFKGGYTFGGKNILTKILIVTQYSTSVFLLITTFTMAKQMKFIQEKELGYKKENILIIDTQAGEYRLTERILNLIKNKTEGDPYIVNISGCLFPLGSSQGEGTLEYNGKKVHFNFSEVYYNYFATMGINFLQGGDFPDPLPNDIIPMIVNKKFVDELDIKNPIGTFIGRDEPRSRIVGVVEDFHYRSLKHEIEPVIHYFDRRRGPRNILIRISPYSTGAVLSRMENIWKEIQPDKPFVYSFLDEGLANAYTEEKQWNSIVLSASVLAIMITCMGLIGITSLVINRRIKEIGIRKVLGASFGKIWTLLTGHFLAMVVVSNLIAWPVGFVIMNKWLQNYAYRTALDAGVFLMAGFLSLFFSLLTICWMVLKASSTNPVECLRYE